MLPRFFKRIGEDTPEEIARLMMDKGKSYSASSRSIHVSNEKVHKKTEKLKLAGRSNTAIFAQVLLHIRRKLKHRGLSLIKVGDKDWLDLKGACKLATDFCQEFQIGIRQGYQEYIEIGMSKMQNFSIFKFQRLHAAICTHYESLQEIQRDNTPEKTKQCHDLYVAIISDKIGLTKGYENQPDKYKYFIKAKEQADKLKVSYKTYMKAQFEGFDWHGGVPDPIQLSGEKAIIRLQQYAFKEGITLGDRKEKGINFKKVKNAKRKS